MGTFKLPKFLSRKKKSRIRRTLTPDLKSSICGHFHSCQHCDCPHYCEVACFHCNQPSMASKVEPNAPPLPPGAEIDPDWIGSDQPPENQPLIQGQGHGYYTESGPSSSSYGPHTPVPYGQIQSYQQYMAPSPAYGVPVWQQHQESRPEWSTGLCHCESDMTICLLGCVCPCILFGKVAEKLDGDVTHCLTAAIVWYILQQFTFCGCIYSCGYRRKLRAKYNLPEKPLPDCLVHFLCWPCAFCQEYRELHVRRIREEAWDYRTVTAPPPEQSMNY